MAASRTMSGIIIAVLVFSVHFAFLRGEKILGREMNDDFDFDGLPGTQHEFKVEVGGGLEECFHQRVASDALMYVHFEVLRGGDRNVDVTLRNSRYEVIDGYYMKSDGRIELKTGREDTYAVCVDNSFSRFTSKLVYLYIMTHVNSDWEFYLQQFKDMKNIAGNLTHSLSTVELSVEEMKKSQTHARFNVIMDYYLVWGNNRYVQYWSMAQCMLIVTSSVAQVVFLRRMFRTATVTPSSKPRA